ncbi:glucosamine-6-phosphate deaminase [Mycoplasmatota bacterium]|nr:glucosamine-6-phosphate deaminase [Mycoplasmatota bacterium]
MEVKVFKNYETLSKAAAEAVINQVKEDSNSIIGLATGSSPIGIYDEMIKDYQNHHTSYQNIKTFNLDEYYGINQDHSQSYYHFMMKHLFKHIDIKQENIHIPNGSISDIDSECDSYNRMLEENQIDIQILGIGSNGHIGFNEPGTSFQSTTHYVKLDEKTRSDNARFFASIEEVPKHAVTMGIQNILNSNKIILVASGKNKADAVYQMVKGPLDSSCPASALQMHDNVTVYVDEEAASKL